MTTTYELVGEFDGYYKRFAGAQNADGGIDLTIGIPKQHKAKILDLTDTDGEMLVFTVQRKIRPRLKEADLEPVDPSFRAWIGQDDTDTDADDDEDGGDGG